MSQTYLTTDELSARIKYDARTIRERLKDSVLLEGIHYIRPFGGRKILYIWEKIETDMGGTYSQAFAIPMANGGVCHGWHQTTKRYGTPVDNEAIRDSCLSIFDFRATGVANKPPSRTPPPTASVSRKSSPRLRKKSASEPSITVSSSPAARTPRASTRSCSTSR